MVQGPNDNKQYTAQDFERYYSGQMSAQEMHALEKAALEDPFLADALDGYKVSRTPAADVAWLKQQLEAKAQKTKVVPIASRKRFPFLRIAALVLLLLGAGWSVYYLMDNKRDTLALDNKATREAAPQEATAPAIAADTANKEVVTLQAESAPVSISPTNMVPHKRVGKTTIIPEAIPPAAGNEESGAEAATVDSPKPMLLRADESRDVAAMQRKETAPAAALQGRVAGVELQKAPAGNAFQGRVVDQHNRGVPNASVRVLNTRTTTATDDQGYFSLNAPDTTVTATVNAIGFQPQNVTLNNRREEANIVLKESDQALNEVVVTGYGKKRKNEATTEAFLPQPVQGWEHFQTYLAQNRRSPKELSVNGLTGSVTLSFEVSRRGTPTNIKVDSSLSPSHDEEAIRLLRKGPLWERKKGTRGKVTIRFE